MDHHLDRVLYDAGNEFSSIIRTWRRLKGLPGVISNGPGTSVSSDDKELADKINTLARRMRDADSAMRPADAAAVRWLTLDAGPMDDIDPNDIGKCERAKHGLLALAVHFGMIKRRMNLSP